MENEEIKLNPLKDSGDFIPIPRVSVTPLDSLDSFFDSYDTSYTNPSELDSEYTLNYDNPIFNIHNEHSDKPETKTIMDEVHITVQIPPLFEELTFDKSMQDIILHQIRHGMVNSSRLSVYLDLFSPEDNFESLSSDSFELDHLGKFDGKADEGFFVGYSLNSKAFKVFNSKTRIVEENLHIRFSESTPNAVGTKAGDNTGQARKETEPVKDYILLPLWTIDPPYSHDLKSSHDDGSKPSSDDGKKVNEDPINVVGGKTSIGLPFDLNMHALEDYSIFDFSRDDEDDGAEANMNNLDTTIQVSPIPSTRIHKDHPLDQVIGDLQSATQTRKMSKNLKEHGFISTIQQRTSHKDLQNCLFACFLSQEEPKKLIHALKDPSWIEAMQEELLQFKLQEDERGIVIRNKSRLVAQGYTQEEGINYDEVFAPIARIKAIRLFLVYASFKDFVVYQMDVKSPFLYGKIEEEVYVCQLPGFDDLDFPDIVYKVEKALYGLHQAPRAWFIDVKTASTPIETQKPLLKDEDGEEVDVHMYRSTIGSLMYLTSSRPNIMFAVRACARYQVNLKVSYLHAMKRILAYTDSDYAGASLDRKSTTESCQFLGCRLISWQLMMNEARSFKNQAGDKGLCCHGVLRDSTAAGAQCSHLLSLSMCLIEDEDFVKSDHYIEPTEFENQEMIIMANLPPNHNEFAPAAKAAPDNMNGWVEEEDPEMEEEEEDPEEDPEMEEEEEEMEMDADEEWDGPE
ncbi:putative ribonuclease H-like domain-containing protein [Tanacetum coccineum]